MNKLTFLALFIALLCSGSLLRASELYASVCKVENFEELKRCNDGKTLFFNLKKSDLAKIGGNTDVILAYFCDFRYPFVVPHKDSANLICIYQRKAGAESTIDELTHQNKQK